MNKKKVLTILLHLTLVLLFLLVPVVMSPDFNFSFDIFKITPFLRNFIAYFLSIGFFYLNLFWIIPNFYYKKNKLSYISLVILAFLLITVIINLVIPDYRFFGLKPPMNDQMMQHHGGPPHPNWFFDRLFLTVPFILMLLASMVFHLSRKTRKVEIDKAKTELQNLKYQLQPHFLFNSLNNIYSLSIVDHEKTPQYILELSQILRYLLTTNNEEKVELGQEIQFINLYINLQRLRFGDESKEWNIQLPTTSALSYRIEPFLMIPLIENVFKYGMFPGKKSEIRIDIEIINNTLRLHTFNRINNTKPQELLISQNIGLSKTRERLNLLYANRFHFQIVETENEYELNLTINLQ